MSTDSNDTAFPVPGIDLTPNNTIQLGLTKREYFAAMAMQGILAEGRDGHIRDRADFAVMCADALIRALNQEQPK